MMQTLQLVVLVLLAVAAGGFLVEWRLRAHLGEARGVVKALKVHVDGFQQAWDDVNGAVGKLSRRVDVLRKEFDPVKEEVERHEAQLRKLRIGP
jgi:hypothetical protein